MRCNICDKELSEKEIIFNQQLKTYEPCTECLDIALEAAYSHGFTIDDDNTVVLDTSFDFEEYDNLCYGSFVEGEDND